MTAEPLYREPMAWMIIAVQLLTLLELTDNAVWAVFGVFAVLVMFVTLWNNRVRDRRVGRAA